MALLELQTSPAETFPTLKLDTLPLAGKAELVEALEMLPLDHRLLLAMFYTEDFTVLEVALALDMTVSDVLTRHAVAMRLIKELLRQKAV